MGLAIKKINLTHAKIYIYICIYIYTHTNAHILAFNLTLHSLILPSRALHGINCGHFSDIVPGILSDICFGKFPLAFYLPVALILTCYLADLADILSPVYSSRFQVIAPFLRRISVEHIKIENSSKRRLSCGSSIAKEWASKPTHSWEPLCQSLEDEL